MSVFTPASEVILRHSDKFIQRRVLFAGDLQDELATNMRTAHSQVHTSQFHHWQTLSRTLGEKAQFSLLATPEIASDCDTLIYFWPKNKPEADFQLQNVLSVLPVGSEIFIVGENRSGVRSAETMLQQWVTLGKIDSARRCGLYHGSLNRRPDFCQDAFISQYQHDGITIKTVPGVFSRDGLDAGSALLLSTLQPHTRGKVLDMGCGTGVLATMLAKHSPRVRLWLTDVSAAALTASRATLAANQIEGEVFASNVWSDVTGRYDLILSNPPFHEGLNTSLDAAQMLIRGARNHLNSGGELRIVANAFLPYAQWLDEVFGQHEVLAKNGRFKVYRAIMGRGGKAGR